MRLLLIRRSAAASVQSSLRTVLVAQVTNTEAHTEALTNTEVLVTSLSIMRRLLQANTEALTNTEARY